MTEEELSALDRYWRAGNHLSVGQIYLMVNPPLDEPLQPERIKPRLLGYWGTIQWRFGATAIRPVHAYAFAARAVRAASDADPVLGYELGRRFFAAVSHRLQANRARLLEAHGHAGIQSRGEPGE